MQIYTCAFLYIFRPACIFICRSLQVGFWWSRWTYEQRPTAAANKNVAWQKKGCVSIWAVTIFLFALKAYESIKKSLPSLRHAILQQQQHFNFHNDPFPLFHQQMQLISYRKLWSLIYRNKGKKKRKKERKKEKKSLQHLWQKWAFQETQSLHFLDQITYHQVKVQRFFFFLNNKQTNKKQQLINTINTAHSQSSRSNLPLGVLRPVNQAFFTSGYIRANIYKEKWSNAKRQSALKQWQACMKSLCKARINKW